MSTPCGGCVGNQDTWPRNHGLLLCALPGCAGGCIRRFSSSITVRNSQRSGSSRRRGIVWRAVSFIRRSPCRPGRSRCRCRRRLHRVERIAEGRVHGRQRHLRNGRQGGRRDERQAGPGSVTITLLTRAVLCGTHDACRLACDSFARKLFRGLSARSLREARAGARLRASCALARTGATRGASRAFRRRGRSCRGWRRNWG